MSAVFPDRHPGASVVLGDFGAVIHGVSSGELVYNRRQPRPWEQNFKVGDGNFVKVSFYGDLDLVLHCGNDVLVLLTNVAVVPDLASFNIIYFLRIPDRYDIVLSQEGAFMLENRVFFKRFPSDYFVQATRVPHDNSRSHDMIIVAMMRPGPPASMNVNDFHCFLGHANVKALFETAKLLGIRLTGVQEYCDGCADAKAIKQSVPKVVNPSRISSRPL